MRRLGLAAAVFLGVILPLLPQALGLTRHAGQSHA